MLLKFIRMGKLHIVKYHSSVGHQISKYLNSSIAGPGPPLVKSKTCLGLSSDWNFMNNFAPWFPPDFGLRNTRRGDKLFSGIGLMQKNSLMFFELSFFSSFFPAILLTAFSWTVANGGTLITSPFLPLRGQALRLFLKFPFGGIFTIHVGGTILWNTKIKIGHTASLLLYTVISSAGN